MSAFEDYLEQSRFVPFTDIEKAAEALGGEVNIVSDLFDRMKEVINLNVVVSDPTDSPLVAADEIEQNHEDKVNEHKAEIEEAIEEGKEAPDIEPPKYFMDQPIDGINDLAATPEFKDDGEILLSALNDVLSEVGISNTEAMDDDDDDDDDLEYAD